MNAAPVQYKLAALVVLLAALGAVIALFVVRGSESSSEQPTPQQVSAADAEAQAAATAAQAAIETWAVDQGGSYEGASTDSLQEIEPALPSNLVVEGSSDGYSVAVPSEVGGNSFTIKRDRNGLTSSSCDVTGTAGCPDNGQWAGR